MTPLKFTDASGNLLVVAKEDIARVTHYYDTSVPPEPPSPLSACIVSLWGSGVYVQESVEKVLSIIEEAP